ncbi:arylsulfatase A-like enzyme [Hephaestia caeni]|uniref:Arylsulfatase A-like enzyme n=1 Tax=Hephaestia caeni TaxID=645617 RepID=A0A397PD89_9SPHN|nr:sulfatase [Hephaestia caeni]RIA46938.1 arylsulfatase A-like enzyme [Hephaestia caeni]
MSHALPGAAAALALLCGCAPTMSAQRPAAPVDRRPNILLIVAEDMNLRVGAFGDTLADTPNIDRLAAEGVRYPNAFTTSGVCSPSRSSLITGVHQQTLGTQHMRTNKGGKPNGAAFAYEAVPPAEVKAFPELLRRAGYTTLNDTKTDYQFGEPFSVWDRSAEGARWRDVPRDKPFFQMITLMQTHESYIWPGDLEPRNAGEAKVIVRNRKNHARYPSRTDPAAVMVPPWLADTPATRRDIARHYDNIHAMDGMVGAILAQLDADGLADDTIVIWTADNGDGLPRAKRSIYDSGIHVPLIIRWPDHRKAGDEDRQLISFVDFAPTLLALARAPLPAYLQGRDFLGDGPKRDYIFAAADRMINVFDRQKAARDARYKYIRNYVPNEPYFRPLAYRDVMPTMRDLWAARERGTLTAVQRALFAAPRPPEELYDVVADPFETVNLAGEARHAAALHRLRGALDEWLRRTPDLSAMDERAMMLSMWPGGIQPQTAPARISRDADGRIRLRSATPGASIEYRWRGDAGAGVWSLYTGPFEPIERGAIETRAIRYGYGASEMVTQMPEGAVAR